MRKLPRKLLLAGFVTALLMLVMLVASPAGALVYQTETNRGYDMRGFVSNTNPMLSCGTGWVGQSSVIVRAPANYGVRVYLTTYLYHWVNGAWQQANGGSVTPGGIWVYAGQTNSFPAGSWRTPSGYWYAYVEADFHQGSGAEVGAVNLKPTSASDFTVHNNAVRYNGTGYSPYNANTAAYATNGYGFCWHG